LLAVHIELFDQLQALAENIHGLFEDLASGQPYLECRQRLRQRKDASGHGLARQHDQELSAYL
jgi:hypothetical protein